MVWWRTRSARKRPASLVSVMNIADALLRERVARQEMASMEAPSRRVIRVRNAVFQEDSVAPEPRGDSSHKNRRYRPRQAYQPGKRKAGKTRSKRNASVWSPAEQFAPHK